MVAKKSLFDALSPSRRTRREVVEEADEALDAALAHLAEATKDNEEAVKEVRKRQSSGKLKIISLRPEALPGN